MDELTRIEFLNQSFSTPLIGSSGTVGYGNDYLAIQPKQVANFYGGLTLKTITPQLLEGNPSPRVCETEFGFINSIGLQNPGLNNFKENIYPQLATLKPHVIASVAAFTTEDFVMMVDELSRLEHIKMIEMNVSCPNVTYHNKNFSSDPILFKEVVSACNRVKRNKPIIVKLSPNYNHVVNMAKLAEDAGVDALAISNTFLGLKIDLNTQKPMIANIIGGYSGPAIKPIVLALIYEVTKEVGLPVIGIGGVMSGEDVVEYLLAGASLVGIATANFTDPYASSKIYHGFVKYLQQYKITARQLKKINSL